MNYIMQICGMLVVLFLFILYSSHKTLHLHSENVFRLFLVVVFVDLLLDALSVPAIHFGKLGAIPGWLVQLSCKSYLISLIWVGWVNFVYVSIDLNSTRERHIRAQLIMAMVSVVESAIVVCLPLDTVENGNSVYSEGPAVIAVYGFTLFYIVSTLIIAIHIRRKKSGRRGFAVIITTCLWICAALIQSLNNELLLVGFSEALGAMMLYIVMENPDAYLDKRFGCFNSYAFHEYMKMCLSSHKEFFILDISINDIRTLEERGLDVEETAQKVIDLLAENRQAHVFKNDLANLVVVSESEKNVSDAASAMLAVTEEYGVSNNSITMFIMRDCHKFVNTAELMKFMTYVRSKSETRISDVLNVTEEMVSEFRDISETEKEIEKALSEDRVEVFLQPIYSNEEEKVVSAEALVRIRNTDGTLFSPGKFIPVAEMTGQIKELGERVLDKVCKFITENDLKKLGLRYIDVNLSAVQCDDEFMAGTLTRIVEKYGIDSSLINFEITETAVSNSKQTLLDNMNDMVSKGFTFALDDFGKGESNLIYIVEMPVSFIKLDIDMSKAYFETAKAKHVVASIADMANRLGMKIVAEGIETQNEAEGIRSEGIHYIQGYYYSKPLPLDEFVEYLK